MKLLYNFYNKSKLALLIQKIVILIVIFLYLPLLEGKSANVRKVHILLRDGATITVDSIEIVGDKCVYSIGNIVKEIDKYDIREISFSRPENAFEHKQDDNTSDLEKWAKEAHTIMQKFPDARCVYLLDKGEYEYRKNNTYAYKYHAITYIAKEEALDSAELVFYYDPNREKITINTARCLSSDGTLHELSKDSIKISKPLSDYDSYNQYQELSFTIPGVDVGSVIEYSYEIETFNPFDPEFFEGRFSFQSVEPIKESILIVKVPKAKNIYYVVKNWNVDDDSKPQIIEDNEFKIYKWSVNNLPPIVTEPYMPAHRDVVPTVYFSLHNNWDYHFKRLKPLFEERFKLTDYVKQKVDKIIEGAKDIHEKIAKIYYFCQKEIRYISVKGNLASNQVGRSAEETLKNGYGDCTDKSMLMATMLKHIGVEAYPIGIRTNVYGKRITEIPLFDANHALVKIILDGRVFFLDPTATDYRYPYFRDDDHDTIYENVLKHEIDTIPLLPPEDNQIKLERICTVNTDGSMEVELKEEANGTIEANNRGYVRSLKYDEYLKDVQTSISKLSPNYKLLIATYSDPLDMSTPQSFYTKYILYDYIPKSGDYLIIKIPNFKMSFPEVSLASRSYDIVYTTTTSKIENIVITIPNDFEVKYLPTPLRINSKYLEFEVTYDIKENQIYVRRVCSFPKRIVPVCDYAEYKLNLEKVARSSNENIFIAKTKKNKNRSEGK